MESYDRFKVKTDHFTFSQVLVIQVSTDKTLLIEV